MYTVYEVDYTDRCYKLGTAETLKEAIAIERKSLKKSGGEFPTFTRDENADGSRCGTKCVTSNGKVLK